ncbi:MAG: response regulator [Polyangiales bacterium]
MTGTEGAPLVLVVDDSLDGRELVVDVLSLSGFRTAEAADGEQALARVRELRPDVVLMDLSLPQIDGWEATRQLKADPETAALGTSGSDSHERAGRRRTRTTPGRTPATEDVGKYVDCVIRTEDDIRFCGPPTRPSARCSTRWRGRSSMG